MKSGVAWILVFVLAAGGLAGCASSARPAPPSPRPVAVGLDGLQRVAVVASGETKFSGAQPSSNEQPLNVLDDILKWLPYKEILVPVARAVYWGVSWLMNSNKSSDAPRDITPGAIVAEAFARALQASGPFDEVTAVGREPVGEARRNVDAIVRLSVPTWGVLSVREGDASSVAAFADVRAQMVTRDNGVVVWQHDEDVTHPERLGPDALKQDRELSREALIEVLERAGRRLANELVYARSRGR